MLGLSAIAAALAPLYLAGYLSPAATAVVVSLALGVAFAIASASKLATPHQHRLCCKGEEPLHPSWGSVAGLDGDSGLLPSEASVDAALHRLQEVSERPSRRGVTVWLT